MRNKFFENFSSPRARLGFVGGKCEKVILYDFAMRNWRALVRYKLFFPLSDCQWFISIYLGVTMLLTAICKTSWAMAKIHARSGETFHTAPRKRDLPQNLRNVTRLMLSAKNRHVTPVRKKIRRQQSWVLSTLEPNLSPCTHSTLIIQHTTSPSSRAHQQTKCCHNIKVKSQALVKLKRHHHDHHHCVVVVVMTWG